MATIATAEVQVIADTSRFVPDLRRKLRAALTGIGTDLGDQISEQISGALRGMGDQINRVIEEEVRRSLPRIERTMGNMGREAAEGFNDGFKDSVTRNADYDQFFARLFHGTIANALEEEAQNAADAFEREFDIEQVAVRKAIAAADAMDGAFEERFARNFSKYEDIFEDEFDLEQAAFRKAVAAADAMDEAFEANFARNFERRGEEAAESLLQGLKEADVPSAFVTDFLNGIDRRQGQINQRMGRIGAGAAAAFFNGVQDAQAPFGGLIPDEVFDEVDTSFADLQRITAVRMRTIGASIRDNIGGAADFANRAVRRLGGSIANIARAVTITPLQNLAQLFSDFTTELASVAAMGLLLLGVLNELTSVLFGLPAALALLSAGAVTVITAFSGMGEAFSAARGSADEFEEAIEGLAPAAQNVAREFRALDDDLDRLRLDAQEALFSELEGAITRVADNIGGPLHDGIVESAGALGELIDGFADFAAEEETAATISATFDALTHIFQALGDEIQPFLGGLRTLVDEFLPELESVEGIIDGIGTEFQEWVDSVTQGDLLSGISPAQRAFQEALDTIQQLGRITGNIASAVGSVFDAADRNGNGFLDLIERISEEVATAFASPEGQDTLAGFLEDLVAISDVVLGVIGTIIEQFPKLADPIADIFENIGPDIETFINNLGDGIAALLEGGGGEFLEELAEALGNLDLERLGSGLGKFLAAIAPLVTVLDEILNFFIVIIDFIGFLALAINALGRVQIAGFTDKLESIGEFFSDFGPRVKDGFDDAIEGIGEFFSEFGPRVADGFGDFVENLGEIGQQIADGFVNIFGPIGEGIADAASAVGDFFTETLPEAIESGLTTAFEFVVNWFTDLKEGWTQFWEGLGGDVSGAFTGIGESVSAGLETLTTSITTWVDARILEWSTFWTGLKDSALLTLENFGLDLTGSLDGITSTFSGWQTGISEGWNSFWTGVKDTARNALNATRDFISNLLSSIRSTISGWIDGIRSRWSSFWSSLSGFVSSGLSAARTTVSNALDGIRDAFSNLTSRVRGILDGLVGFVQGVFDRIRGIVDRIAGAISGAISAAQNLGNIDLNPFADGGIVHGPTPALVGEAGREVIIPLTRPQRAVELVQQSGLMGLLASQGALGAATGVTSGSSPEIHVHSALADPEQIARRAVRILERQSARGLTRTGG